VAELVVIIVEVDVLITDVVEVEVDVEIVFVSEVESIVTVFACIVTIYATSCGNRV
jgi:hypothetical protein